MKIGRTTRIGLITSLAVLLLSSIPAAAACDDKSAEEQLCDDLDELATAVKSIQDVSPGSAVADLQEVRTDVQQALGNIRESAQDVPEVQALEDAVDSFAAAVEQLPEGTSVGDAIRDLGQEIINLTAAFQNLRDTLDCE